MGEQEECGEENEGRAEEWVGGPRRISRAIEGRMRGGR